VIDHSPGAAESSGTALSASAKFTVNWAKTNEATAQYKRVIAILSEQENLVS